jgi:replicative DNA helicase
MDDIKEANKIAYKAQATILCYNDVGLKGESANVYWQKDGSPAKQPVLEAFVGKNKLSDFKKRIFFEFMPELAYCKEATPQATIRYNQMIMG